MVANVERVKGLLFDKDGTLLDFHKTWGRLGEEVIATLSAGEPRLARMLAGTAGYDLATQRYAPGSPIVAGSTTDLVRAWLPHLHLWTAAELEIWLNAQAATVARRGVVAASEDLPALLRRLRDAGLRLGVATHDAEAPARAQLEDLGVAAAFDFVAGYDSGYAPKPDDAMLRGFCAHVGLSVSEVLVIGDSAHDLGMGRRGGALASIGVLTGPATRSDLDPLADRVLGSIDELPDMLGI